MKQGSAERTYYVRKMSYCETEQRGKTRGHAYDGWVRKTSSIFFIISIFIFDEKKTKKKKEINKLSKYPYGTERMYNRCI